MVRFNEIPVRQHQRNPLVIEEAHVAGRDTAATLGGMTQLGRFSALLVELARVKVGIDLLRSRRPNRRPEEPLEHEEELFI